VRERGEARRGERETHGRAVRVAANDNPGECEAEGRRVGVGRRRGEARQRREGEEEVDDMANIGARRRSPL